MTIEANRETLFPVQFFDFAGGGTLITPKKLFNALILQSALPLYYRITLYRNVSIDASRESLVTSIFRRLPIPPKDYCILSVETKTLSTNIAMPGVVLRACNMG